MKTMLFLAATLVLSACNASSPPVPAETNGDPGASAKAAPATVRAAPEKTISKADFEDKVWKVAASNAVQAGSTYTFLRNGTLVVDSPANLPLYGSWSYEGGRLVMTEEGLPYPTDILHLDASSFRIRSHNPGQAVDISMVSVRGAALPPPSPSPPAR